MFLGPKKSIESVSRQRFTGAERAPNKGRDANFSRISVPKNLKVLNSGIDRRSLLCNYNFVAAPFDSKLSDGVT
jgi:hypothetical protein